MPTAKILLVSTVSLAIANVACSKDQTISTEAHSQVSADNTQSVTTEPTQPKQDATQDHDVSKNTPSHIESTCVISQTTKDKDFINRGNAQLVQQHQIQLTQCNYVINGQAFKLDVYQKQPIGNLRYLVLHDSEDAAFDSGLDAIKDGGLMVVLENNDQRHLFDQNSQSVTKSDPNRIFKPSDANFAFGQIILNHLNIQPNSHIIALHNNSPSGGFGMSNITNYGATDIACDTGKNNKNLFWIPFSSKSPNAQQIAKELCQFGQFNVVTENVPKVASGDGSLSIFAGNQGFSYVNIEVKAAERGDQRSEQNAKAQQIAHIQALSNILKAY